MPFSFKPEITSTTPDGQAPSAGAPAAFGNNSSVNYAEREPSQSRSFLQLVLMGVLAVMVIAAIGLFGYSSYLSTQIESKKAALASYESRLGTLPLEDMRKMSNRIKLINQLVKEHPSANVAFRIIEDSVENPVTYDRLDLHYSETTKSYQLQLGGVSPNYKTIAQQIDTLNRKPYTTYIQNIVVDGLHPDDTGKVGFTLRMKIAIEGLLPEGLNLSEGAAERLASSTPEIPVILNDIPTATTTATTTVVAGSSTPKR